MDIWGSLVSQETGANWDHAALEPILQVVTESAQCQQIELDVLIPYEIRPCSLEVFQLVRARAMDDN